MNRVVKEVMSGRGYPRTDSGVGGRIGSAGQDSITLDAGRRLRRSLDTSSSAVVFVLDFALAGLMFSQLPYLPR